MNNNITQEYLLLQEKYEKIYGEKTVVLMEVGSFFEMYCIDKNNNPLNFKLPRMLEIGFYPHIPGSYLKSQFKLFVNKYFDYIKWIRSFTNRKGIGCDMCYKLLCPCQQIHGPIHIFMYQNGKAVLNKDYKHRMSCSIEYINSTCMHLLDKILVDPPEIFCINDTEIDIKKRKIIYDKMHRFFIKMYPDKLIFEK